MGKAAPKALGGLASDLPFRDLRLIVSNAGFVALSATSGQRRLVVVRPAARADPKLAREALRRLSWAHARVRHPCVAPLGDVVLEGPTPFVALEFAAVASGLEVAARLARAGRRLSYAGGDGFVMRLRQALQAAHAAPGGPHCLGRISLANICFDASGRWQLFGFGHNVAVCDEHGRPDPRVRSFGAPELLVHDSPTPMGDYIALLQLARSIVEHVELPRPLARVLAGSPEGLTERMLARWVRYTEQRVLGELPGQRPSMKAALRAAGHIRALLGVGVDPDQMPRLAAELLALEQPVEVDPTRWYVAPDASYVERDGRRIELTGPGRAIFVALLDRALWSDGQPADVWTLAEEVWPDQPFHYERSRNRVHSTLSRLRRAGLESVIVRCADGYRVERSELALPISMCRPP